MQEFHSPETIERVNQTITEILKNHYSNPEGSPAIPFRTKREIIDEFHQPETPQKGIGLENTLAYFRDKMLPSSVRTWHPMFMNQMFAGASFPSIIGDMLASMMNPTLATWEMAPVATIIERNVSQWMAQILGMPEGSSGIFLPGGSLANLLALTVARNQRLDPQVASSGMRAIDQGGAILCSDSCHYSITNAGNLLGIGADQVIKVETNDRGEMLVGDLKKKILTCRRRGLKPFVAVATMGITVTGGFDPLEEISEICRKEDIHLHVDAAFGGGMAMTDRGAEIFKGIEYADTAIWDAHKWLHVPLTCTVLLTPDAGILKHIFSSNADYIYHPQEEDIDLAEDLGQYTILCGKRFDALRVWILFQAFGEPYFRKLANDRLEFTQAVADLIAADPDFQLSYQPKSPIICFRFLPSDLADDQSTYVDQLQRWVRSMSLKKNLAMYNVTKLKGRDHFRMILINPLTTLDHMRQLLEAMRELGREYLATQPK